MAVLGRTGGVKQRELWISLGLAVASYLVCIVAQGFPLWSVGQAFSLVPTDVWTRVECLGFVSGVVGVYLMVKESVWNYPVGLIWAVAYALFFFLEAKHYGEATVMVVSVGYLLMGWRNWLRGIGDEGVAVRRISGREMWVVGGTVLLGWPAVYFVVSAMQGAYPLVDSLTTVLSFGAQYLTNRKVLESWWVWIVADLVYLPLMAYRGYYPSAILYGVFLVMAVVGLRAWRRSFGAGGVEAAV